MVNNILIVGPFLHAIGGVAHYYKTLLSTNAIKADYLEYGKPIYKGNKLYQLSDLFKFIVKLKHYEVIHLNPSLDSLSLIRDLTYAFIAILCRKKVLISFMGWNENIYNKLKNNKIYKKIFSNILNNCLHITLPVPFFINKLKQLDVKTKMTLLYPPFDIDQLKEPNDKKSFEGKLGVLFMARIEESKGVYKLLDIFENLQHNYGELFTFTICGDGYCLEDLKLKAEQKNIPVKFTGNVSGKEKMLHYKNNQIFLYPSQHAEGFPLVLAEVLMNGFVVISSDAGGIGGVLDNRNGYVVGKDSAAEIYQNAIIEVIEQADLLSISKYNREFAEKHFSPINIAKKLNTLYGAYS